LIMTFCATCGNENPSRQTVQHVFMQHDPLLHHIYISEMISVFLAQTGREINMQVVGVRQQLRCLHALCHIFLAFGSSGKELYKCLLCSWLIWATCGPQSTTRTITRAMRSYSERYGMVSQQMVRQDDVYWRDRVRMNIKHILTPGI
jgi:hypothetical protein